MLNIEPLQYATTHESRFSRIERKAIFIGITCFALCLFFFIVIGNVQTPRKVVKQAKDEIYELSIKPTHLNSSGEWIEVDIATSEPLQSKCQGM